MKTRFDSQLSRRNRQTFSTGLSSGEREGNRTIHEQDGVGALRHGLRYLGEMQGHGRAVAERQDKTGALALFGADGAKEIGR